jgi:sulfate transport system ATP-binding protein
MNQGRIEQIGAPGDIYDNPATRFVYEFLGDVTVLDGNHLRPHDIEIAHRGNLHSLAVAATVAHIAAAGPAVRVELRREDVDEIVEAEITRERYRSLGLQIGDRVEIAPRHSHLFSA